MLKTGLLACCSKEKYLGQIRGCRQTWCKNNENVYFFSGENCPFQTCDKQVIHLPKVLDDYMSATYKQWYGLIWLYENYPVAKFYYLAGTDTYARLDKIESYLETLNSEEKLYIGGHGDVRNVFGKDIYFHSGGSGFILSNSLMKTIYPHIRDWMQKWDSSQGYLRVACDVSLPSLFVDLNIEVRTIKLNTFYGCSRKTTNCCGEKVLKDIWVCHYMEPEDMLKFETEINFF